ncbi:hypothetical protein ABEV34_29380 [Methylorubrum rhodesianum]|uniref:hypothetical protein n=1 Tax=Methylorubrum rhodesianum TaxID=29427 RepID=UPI003D26B403
MTAQGGALRSAWLRAPPQNRRATFLMCYGPEFIAKSVQAWITGVGARTAYMSTGTEVSAIVGFQNSLAGGFGADR